jgi:hypothetical protein
MITFLSSPKPFQGIAKEHQYRAVANWLTVAEGAEVILYGDSAGIEEAGADLGVRVQKEIGCAPSGVPYFGAMAAHAAEHGRYDLQVYLNGDILLHGLHSAMSRIPFERFLLIGQCIDLGEGVVVEEPPERWLPRLRELAGEGRVAMRTVSGIDYFGFRRGTWSEIPPVVIGRAAYDQALLAYCQRRRHPLVDATFAVTALHQYHGYGHVAGGSQTVTRGQDAQNNLRFAGSHGVSTISDADYVLRGSEIRHRPCRGDRLRRLELAVRYRLGWHTLSLGVRSIWRVARPLGLTPSVEPALAEVLAAQEESLRFNAPPSGRKKTENA